MEEGLGGEEEEVVVGLEELAGEEIVAGGRVH